MLHRWWSRHRLGTIHLAAAACLLVAACDHSSNVVMTTTPSPKALRLETPDRNFKLTPQERASIRPGFDVDALERLLASVEPPFRPFFLSSFQAVEPGMPGRVLVKMGDPTLQPLLDEVWAPIWEMYPEMMDTETKEYPGRELARQRRAARRRPEQ